MWLSDYYYSILSHFQSRMHDNAWAISTEAGRDVCEPLLQKCTKEMNSLREELVDQERILLVKNLHD